MRVLRPRKGKTSTDRVQEPMSRQARSMKQKYICLATALLLVGKLFERLKNKAPLVPRLDDIWPRDSTFSRKGQWRVTGLDVFARDMYKKPRIGEHLLDHYAKIYKKWHNELDENTKEKYEAMARHYNTRYGDHR